MNSRLETEQALLYRSRGPLEAKGTRLLVLKSWCKRRNGIHLAIWKFCISYSSWLRQQMEQMCTWKVHLRHQVIKSS